MLSCTYTEDNRIPGICASLAWDREVPSGEGLWELSVSGCWYLDLLHLSSSSPSLSRRLSPPSLKAYLNHTHGHTDACKIRVPHVHNTHFRPGSHKPAHPSSPAHEVSSSRSSSSSIYNAVRSDLSRARKAQLARATGPKVDRSPSYGYRCFCTY